MGRVSGLEATRGILVGGLPAGDIAEVSRLKISYNLHPRTTIANSHMNRVHGLKTVEMVVKFYLSDASNATTSYESDGGDIKWFLYNKSSTDQLAFTAQGLKESLNVTRTEDGDLYGTLTVKSERGLNAGWHTSGVSSI